MKTQLITSLKQIAGDRLMVVLLSVFILACLAYCLYVGVSLRPSDLQVAVHYSAFGETRFYREKWYYLLSFIMFGLILAIVHTALIVKMYVQERRQLALLFTYLSFGILLITWILTHSILNVAFL